MKVNRRNLRISIIAVIVAIGAWLSVPKLEVLPAYSRVRLDRPTTFIVTTASGGPPDLWRQRIYYTGDQIACVESVRPATGEFMAQIFLYKTGGDYVAATQLVKDCAGYK